MKSIIFPLMLLVGVGSCDDKRPVVKTPYGTYKGEIIKSRNGREILSFKGIPYAEPPVGKLRFKAPVKLEKREGSFDATQEVECVQPGLADVSIRDVQSKFIGVEDCLYLNIFKPKDVSTKKLLPVYFFIHGGAFFGGSGGEDWNGPRYLLDEKRDMIMVNINYRLGILGFLSANDENLPGNLGLKDQTMALKWVKENIELFGGDPNSITIGGLSAGAASVSHHLNSKVSKGLFQRAISHSGTADCSWALKSTDHARKIASNIISFLQCPFEPKELMECLEELPIDIIMNALDILEVENTSLIMYLVPVVEEDSENAFMTKQSIEDGSDVPFLTGVTSEEGLIFYQFYGLKNPDYFNLSLMLNDKYKKIWPIVAYYGPRSGDEQITKELKDFYFGNQEFNEDSSKNFIQLLSDRMFNHGLHLTAKKYKGKLYMYKISYRGKNTLAVFRPKGLENAVSHGDDMFYFFNTKFPAIELKDEDLDFSNSLLEMWYNFIRSGNPTPDTKLWEESDGGKKYIDFTNDGPMMASNMFKERMEFHDKLEKIWSFHDEL